MASFSLLTRSNELYSYSLVCAITATSAVDQGEAADALMVLLARDRVQFVQEPLFGLEHFDELHHAAVGDVEFSVEVIGAGVGSRCPVLGQRLNVDAAGQFRLRPVIWGRRA